MDLEYMRIMGLSVVNVLRLLVMTLDLAVASYAGAHCSEVLDGSFPTSNEISPLATFEDCSDDREKVSTTFKKCHLQCLDRFLHGKGVWVFCPPNCKPSPSLYLSTTIDKFADIWGPLGS